MAEQQFRFEDGAAYERMMGVWSRIAGAAFLDWVTPPPGQRWLDVDSCGFRRPTRDASPNAGHANAIAGPVPR